jgi:hypothetical protein
MDFDETETAAAAGGAVADHGDGIGGYSSPFQPVLEFGLCCLIRKVSHVKFHGRVCSFSSNLEASH